MCTRHCRFAHPWCILRVYVDEQVCNTEQHMQYTISIYCPPNPKDYGDIAKMQSTFEKKNRFFRIILLLLSNCQNINENKNDHQILYILLYNKMKLILHILLLPAFWLRSAAVYTSTRPHVSIYKSNRLSHGQTISIVHYKSSCSGCRPYTVRVIRYY